MSQPQLDPLTRLADALLVREGPKTPAALQRQFAEAPDPSSWADFLSISLWLASEARAAVGPVRWPDSLRKRNGPERPGSSTSTRRTPWARKTRTPAIWSPWLSSLTPPTMPIRMGFVTSCARCGPVRMSPQWTCGSTCGRRPSGVSTGIGRRSAGSPSGANPASPGRFRQSWPPSAQRVEGFRSV